MFNILVPLLPSVQNQLFRLWAFNCFILFYFNIYSRCTNYHYVLLHTLVTGIGFYIYALHAFTSYVWFDFMRYTMIHDTVTMAVQSSYCVLRSLRAKTHRNGKLITLCNLQLYLFIDKIVTIREWEPIPFFSTLHLFSNKCTSKCSRSGTWKKNI